MPPTETPTRENLILVGVMGTGKSSIGRQVARRLGFQFLDTDQLIVEREGAAVTDIFKKLGEAAFRALETRTLESLEHLTRCVIATGGGIVMREENREILRRLGFVVGLTASPDVVFQRVSRNNKRPLLHTDDPRETVHRLLAERAEAYKCAAQFTVDTSALTQPEAAALIVAEARKAFSWQSAQ
jgi:shikimate kinase